MKQLPLLVILFILIGCSGTPETTETVTEAPEESNSVQGSEVTYSTDSTVMKGYISTKGSTIKKKPGILIVHEWWGHNEYTRARADMLAQLGYVALAVDMYGDGKQAAHPEDAGKFAGQVFANMDEAKAKFEAAMKQLKSHPDVDPDKIAAIGYCFGGSVVLTMANAGYDLDAVAAFHSGVELPIPPNKNLRAKVLVAQGAADPFVSPESAIAFQAAMDEIDADYKYIVYDSAVHAFTNPGADALGKKFNLPLAYQQKADDASWQELQDLLNYAFN